MGDKIRRFFHVRSVPSKKLLLDVIKRSRYYFYWEYRWNMYQVSNPWSCDSISKYRDILQISQEWPRTGSFFDATFRSGGSLLCLKHIFHRFANPKRIWISQSSNNTVSSLKIYNVVQHTLGSGRSLFHNGGSNRSDGIPKDSRTHNSLFS